MTALQGKIVTQLRVSTTQQKSGHFLSVCVIGREILLYCKTVSSAVSLHFPTLSINQIECLVLNLTFYSTRSLTSYLQKSHGLHSVTVLHKLFGRMQAFLSTHLLQIGLLSALLFQNVLHGVILHVSRAVPPESRYFASTAVLCTEVLKMLFSIGALFYESGGVKPVFDFLASAKTWKNALPLSFPAVIYTFQNNLQYISLTYISASEFQLLVQMKTFTTAVFSIIFLDVKLTRVQWFAIILLIVGVTMAQLPHCQNAGVDAAKSLDIFSAYFYGVSAALMLTLLSGAAGVYQEKVLKKQIDLSIHYLNLQLAILSFGTNLISIYVQDGALIAEKGFFFGYNFIVWFTIVCAATGGLLVALVIRYTSNLAKSYAVSLSIFMTQIVSYLFLGGNSATTFTLSWSLAASVVFISSLLYMEPSNSSPPSNNLPEKLDSTSFKIDVINTSLTQEREKIETND